MQTSTFFVTEASGIEFDGFYIEAATWSEAMDCLRGLGLQKFEDPEVSTPHSADPRCVCTDGRADERDVSEACNS